MINNNYSHKDVQHWKYNLLDVKYTYDCAKILQAQLNNSPVLDFWKFQQGTMNRIVLKLMERGVKVDLQEKERLLILFKDIQEKVQAKLNEVVGEPFKPNSSVHLKKLFIDILGCKPSRSKSGNASFDYASMMDYAVVHPMYKPLIMLILEYKSISIFIGNFLNANVDPDRRIRCSYNLCGTVTYRLSSSKNRHGRGVNLQTLPSRGKLQLNITNDIEEIENAESQVQLPNCKTMFIPDKDFIIFEVDYSSADAMIVAWESEDQWLIDYFSTQKEKLYVYLAKEYLQETISPDNPWYIKFKRIVHLSNYGGSARKVASASNISLADATKIQRFYFNKARGLPNWHRKVREQVDRGSLTNIFGARRLFWNKRDTSNYRKAYAWIPQSTIAILVNKGIANLARAGNTQLLMQTHDSATGQFSNKEDLQTMLNTIKSCMEIQLPYKVPLTIPANIKTSENNYGECK